jgi:F0F1-type ATP synthase assembly protein I
MSEQTKDKQGNKSSLKNILTKPLVNVDSKAMQYSGLGVTLVVTILIFLWIGMWIDGKLSTSPWFTLGFTLVGFSAGFYSFYLNIKRMSEQDKKDNPKFNKF